MKRTKLLKTQPCEAPRISSEEDVICASQSGRREGPGDFTVLQGQAQRTVFCG